MKLQKDEIHYGYDIEEGCQQDDDEVADICANTSYVKASRVADDLDLIFNGPRSLNSASAINDMLNEVYALQKVLRREE